MKSSRSNRRVRTTSRLNEEFSPIPTVTRSGKFINSPAPSPTIKPVLEQRPVEEENELVIELYFCVLCYPCSVRLRKVRKLRASQTRTHLAPRRKKISEHIYSLKSFIDKQMFFQKLQAPGNEEMENNGRSSYVVR